MASDVSDRYSTFQGLEEYLDDDENFEEPLKEGPLFSCQCRDTKSGRNVDVSLFRDHLEVGLRRLPHFADIDEITQNENTLEIKAFVDPLTARESVFHYMTRREIDPRILNGEIIDILDFSTLEECWQMEILTSAMIRASHQQFFEKYIRRNQNEYFQYWCKAAKITSSGVEQGRDLFLSNEWLYMVHLTHPATVTTVKWALPIISLYSLVLDTIHEQHSVLIVFDSRKVSQMDDEAHTFEKGIITGDSKRFIFGNARNRAILVKEIQRLFWKLSGRELLVQVDDDSASVSNSQKLPGGFGAGDASPRVLTGTFWKLRKAGLFAKAMKSVKWIPVGKKHGLIEWSDPDRGGQYSRHIVVAVSHDQLLLSGRLDESSLRKLFIVITETRRVAFITNTDEEKQIWVDTLKLSVPVLNSSHLGSI